MKSFNRKVLIFVALIGIVSCLDCHQCASKDGGCRDPYDADGDDDNSDGCDAMDTHCFKHKIVLRLYDSGAITGKSRETVTETRGCEKKIGYSDGCHYQEVDAGFMFYCLCSTDNCNAVEITLFSKVTLILSTLVALIVRNFC